MDQLAYIYWIVALVEQSISVLLYIPALFYYFKYREEHHIITKSFLLLVIPDLILLANYFPLHIMALVDGATLPGSGCSISAMIILAGIVASNVGSVAIAATTKRMLDVRDRAVKPAELAIWGLSGWVGGLILGGGYAASDQLGPHRNLYCCMKNGYTLQTALPTFFVYGFAVSAMLYYYHRAIRQVKDVVESTTNKGAQQSNAAQGLLKRAVLICSIYYFTWSLVALLGALEWAGVEYNRWWDAVAAWQIKAGPILDAALLLYTVRRVHAQKMANRNRAGSLLDNGKDGLRRRESSNRNEGSSVGPRPLRVASTDSPLSPVRHLPQGNTERDVGTPDRVFNARPGAVIPEADTDTHTTPVNPRRTIQPQPSSAEAEEKFQIKVEPAIPVI